jgi:hypothetical protein
MQGLAMARVIYLTLQSTKTGLGMEADDF